MTRNNFDYTDKTKELFSKPSCLEGYESPISMIVRKNTTKILEEREDAIVARISEELGFDINKEEIIKALEYDRNQYSKGYDDGYRRARAIFERPQGKWVPIKYRPMTSEERKEFAEHYGIEYCDTLEEKAFDCPMPEDGQKILISTLWGVDIDVVDNDIDGEGFICYGLEGNGDWSGVVAWQPLPERYKDGDAK